MVGKRFLSWNFTLRQYFSFYKKLHENLRKLSEKFHNRLKNLHGYKLRRQFCFSRRQSVQTTQISIDELTSKYWQIIRSHFSDENICFANAESQRSCCWLFTPCYTAQKTLPSLTNSPNFPWRINKTSIIFNENILDDKHFYECCAETWKS